MPYITNIKNTKEEYTDVNVRIIVCIRKYNNRINKSKQKTTEAISVLKNRNY